MELKELFEKAWSFTGSNPPNGAKKVAETTKGKEVYEFFMDAEGNVYYETTTSKKWKEKINRWEKEQKKKR